MDLPPLRYVRTSDGVNIATYSMGSGPPLLFLPMTGDGGFELLSRIGSLAALFEAIAQHFTLVSYDPRNEGASDHQVRCEGMDDFLLDVDAVVRGMGDGPYALWGMSWSSPLALEQAAREPERVSHLILSRPITATGEGETALRDALVKLHEVDPQAAGSAYASVIGTDDPDEITAFVSRIQSNLDSPRIRAARSTFDASGALSAISAPTLVFQFRATRDDEAARRIAAEVADARLIDMQSFDPAPILDEVVPFVLGEDRTERDGDSAAAGFRTILFSDVVGSTPLLATLKDERMRRVMRDHDAVVETAVTGHGGRVVKSLGDGVMAEFALPSGAVEAAIAMQRGIRKQFADSDVPVRLRIGINAGEPILENDDLHGTSVNIAKRLESEAAESGILISDVVRQAVAGKDFEMRDQGELTLKGFEEPVRSWSVLWS